MRSARVVTVIGFLLIFISFSFAGFIATADEGMLNTTPSPMTDNSQMMDVPKMATGSATESDYMLPYPGILPGHPLFFLKLTRDNLLNFLIRDSIKRIEFDLLMADKRLNMGVLLLEKGEKKQAAEIVLKGEEYFEKALEDLDIAIADNREVPPSLINQLKASATKHDEVLMQMMEKDLEEYEASVAEAHTKAVEIKTKLDQFGI